MPRHPRPARWSVAKCQYLLLCAAAFSDRQLALEEQEEIRALVGRSPSMQEMAAETKAAIWEEALSTFERGDWDQYVALAIASLPSDQLLAKSIYAHCADIVFADRRIQKSERKFLDRIARALKLGHQDRLLIDEVMALKNRN